MENCINTDDLLTVSDYAARTGHSREQIHYYIKAGYLQNTKIGRFTFVKKDEKIRFPKNEIDRRLDQVQKKKEKEKKSNN